MSNSLDEETYNRFVESVKAFVLTETQLWDKQANNNNEIKKAIDDHLEIFNEHNKVLKLMSKAFKGNQHLLTDHEKRIINLEDKLNRYLDSEY